MSIETEQSTKYKLSKRVALLSIAGALVLFAVLVIIVVVSGINSSERAVARFHEQLNAGQYSEIYAQSTAELKQTMSEAEFTKWLEKIRLVHGPVGELGRAGEKRLNATNINAKLFGGIYITLLYETDYTLATAEETFVFSTNGGQARLFSYNITSPPLRLHNAMESGTTGTTLPIKIELKDVEFKIQPSPSVKPAN
jgi:hypothetical protein